MARRQGERRLWMPWFLTSQAPSCILGVGALSGRTSPWLDQTHASVSTYTAHTQTCTFNVKIKEVPNSAQN